MSNYIDNSLIKVISFNLKRDMKMGKKNKWNERKELAAKLITESGASIIGVQELLPDMKEDFQYILKNDYTIIGDGRYAGHKPQNDEHSDIIINNTETTVLAYKTFWLSKNPEKQSSRGTFAIFPRICTVAEIYVKEANQKIRVFNTHFDHISGLARNLGVRIILEYMSRYNNIEPLPTILMGDLNSKPNSHPVQILRNNLHAHKSIHLTDVYTCYSEEKLCNTFHNFKGNKNTKKNPIDYMFVSDDFEIKESYIATDSYDGKYPSDHYPLIALLKLKKPVLA
ncbi:MAG: endonuclease/exonuclease/phosphatase family protein [Oscillospiraceae bacterium]